MSANRYEVSLGDNETVLELDSYGVCITLNTLENIELYTLKG